MSLQVDLKLDRLYVVLFSMFIFFLLPATASSAMDCPYFLNINMYFEDIFPILETIFEINGVAAVKVGNIYKIIPVKDAKKQPLIPQIGKELEDLSSPDRLIFQIVPLRYIDVKEMEKIVKNFLGPGGVTVDYPERNILLKHGLKKVDKCTFSFYFFVDHSNINIRVLCIHLSCEISICSLDNKGNKSKG